MATDWPTPFQLLDTLRTEETVSGTRTVCVSLSGQLRVAMAGVSGRMPAVGVATDNFLSGDIASFVVFGAAQASSGLVNFANAGRTVWVGRSGQLAQLSGSWLSGGFLSGDILQRAGVAYNSGGLRVHLELGTTYSGALVSLLGTLLPL